MLAYPWVCPSESLSYMGLKDGEWDARFEFCTWGVHALDKLMGMVERRAEDNFQYWLILRLGSLGRIIVSCMCIRIC